MEDRQHEKTVQPSDKELEQRAAGIPYEYGSHNVESKEHIEARVEEFKATDPAVAADSEEAKAISEAAAKEKKETEKPKKATSKKANAKKK